MSMKKSGSRSAKRMPPLKVIRNGQIAGGFQPRVGMRLRNDFEVTRINRGTLEVVRPDRGKKTVKPGMRDYAVTFREAHRFGFTPPSRKRKTGKKPHRVTHTEAPAQAAA